MNLTAIRKGDKTAYHAVMDDYEAFTLAREAIVAAMKNDEAANFMAELVMSAILNKDSENMKNEQLTKVVAEIMKAKHPAAQFVTQLCRLANDALKTYGPPKDLAEVKAGVEALLAMAEANHEALSVDKACRAWFKLSPSEKSLALSVHKRMKEEG